MYAQRVIVFCKIFLVLLVLSSTAPAAHAQDEGATPASATQSGENSVLAAATLATELLVYDLNRPVTKRDHGFPKDIPPRAAANGDWTTPVNFAQGTFYFRAEIRHQPKPQNMKLQFCAWQYSYTLENCSALQSVVGTPGNVVTWSQTVQSLWKKDGKIIDWKNPRQRYGMVIKNSRGKPVSSLKNWNWNGENPDEWYPLDMHFTVVVVAKGATFGGWRRYLGTNADATASDLSASTPTIVEEDNNPDLGSGLDPSDFAGEDRTMLLLPMVSNR